ncbi:uncharacterized protein RAG0_05786 [Rhynchosporium agropyri]|uniref:Zn(2)-C6 fungal-type domain-containing protein n=1 Tax=Rhynchosporium agropyri TaxID=914238 RepID=A0A1E1KEU2_9HELO|nr:uncharacterized protein RAG0_05786 [Rhynchosporium agropyri]
MATEPRSRITPRDNPTETSDHSTDGQSSFTLDHPPSWTPALHLGSPMSSICGDRKKQPVFIDISEDLRSSEQARIHFIRLACLQCTAKVATCDFDYPNCGSCAAYGLNCVYGPTWELTWKKLRAQQIRDESSEEVSENLECSAKSSYPGSPSCITFSGLDDPPRIVDDWISQRPSEQSTSDPTCIEPGIGVKSPVFAPKINADECGNRSDRFKYPEVYDFPAKSTKFDSRLTSKRMNGYTKRSNQSVLLAPRPFPISKDIKETLHEAFPTFKKPAKSTKSKVPHPKRNIESDEDEHGGWESPELSASSSDSPDSDYVPASEAQIKGPARKKPKININ